MTRGRIHATRGRWARWLVAAAVVGPALAAPTARAALPEPPWKRSPAIPATAGDAALVAREWRAADNRATCAPLAFNSIRIGAGAGARARRAEFSGGWAVAYDLPGRRSAFGLAGAGIEIRPEDIARWPSIRRWSDGSAAGYGLEGDTGPGHIAYIRVAGQRCNYNLWSDLGRRHLLALMAQMRFVTVR